MKIKLIADIKPNPVNDYECDMFECLFFGGYATYNNEHYCNLFCIGLNGLERCEECLNAEQV